MNSPRPCPETDCNLEPERHAALVEALRAGELDPITREDLVTEALDLAEAEDRVRRPRIGWARPMAAAAAVLVVGFALFLAVPREGEPPVAAGEEGAPQAVATGSVDAQREANLAFLQRPETQARIAALPDGTWIGIQHGDTLVSADGLGKLDVLLKKAELPEGTPDPQLAHPRALHRFTFRKGTGGDRAFRAPVGSAPPLLGEGFWKAVGISFSAAGDRTAFKRYDGERMYGRAFLVERRRGKGTELPMHIGEPGSMGGIQQLVAFLTRSTAPLVLPNGTGFPRFEVPGRATLDTGMDQSDHPGVFRRYMASVSIPELDIREQFVEAIGNAEILERDDGTLRLGGATWKPWTEMLFARADEETRPILLLERKRWMTAFPGDPFQGLPTEGVRMALAPYKLVWRELPDRSTWIGPDGDAPPADARLTVLDPTDTDPPLRQLVVRPWTRPEHVQALLAAGLRAWEARAEPRPAIEKNEQVAIRVLRDVHRAQENAKRQRVIDTDGDGVGEYATLGEMTGVDAGRRSDRLRPPLIPNAYAPKPGDMGDLVISGYRVRLFFPARYFDGIPVTVMEPTKDTELAKAMITATWRPAEEGGPLRVDVDLAEQHWWAYAWPLELEATGRRTFYIDEDGEIWATESWAGAYEGRAFGPAADAAFATPGRYPGGVSPALRSADGNRWRKVP